MSKTEPAVAQLDREVMFSPAAHQQQSLSKHNCVHVVNEWTLYNNTQLQHFTYFFLYYRISDGKMPFSIHLDAPSETRANRVTLITCLVANNPKYPLNI